MKAFLFTVLLTFATWATGQGQDLQANATISKPHVVSRTRVIVRVLDKETLQPVHATIIVVGQKPGKQIIPAFEDRVYKFKIPANDTSNITIYAKGYETLNESITASKMNATEVFYLTPKSNRNSKAERVAELTRPVLNEEITLVLYFTQSRVTMVAKSKPELERMLDFLKRHETLEIELEGHTDSKGDPDKNFRLSGDRANMVRKYLIANQVAPGRIRSRAFGSKIPVAPNDTEKNRRLNRRVEMKVRHHF